MCNIGLIAPPVYNQMLQPSIESILDEQTNKEDNVFTDERDVKGLRAKVQDSRFRFLA